MKKGLIILMVVSLIATVFVGCGYYDIPKAALENLNPTNDSTGTIQVHVTDAPGEVTSVNVTVSEVKVHKAGDEGEPGEWINLPVQEDTFDLIALEDITLLLAENEVEAGKYTQLRMTVFEVVVMTEDGPQEGYQATVPSGELKFVRPFTLEAGGEIHLIVDIDASKSVLFPGGKKSEPNKVIFKPVVKLMVEEVGQDSEEEPVVFNPTIGPVGTIITVNEEGWTADEIISAVTVGGEAAVHTLSVDSSGNLMGTITVPVLAPGTHDIAITGATSGLQTYTDAFTVIPTATFTPNSGPVNTLISVIGTGWVNSDTIDAVTFGGESAPNTLAIDAFGNLTGTITVPVLVPGVYDIVISGTGSGEQTFTDAFTVISTALFSPVIGPVGTSISVTGTGWANSDTIDAVTFGGEAATYLLTVDVFGNITGTITVPTLTPDIYDIIITGLSSGEQTYIDAFTVIPTAVFTPVSGSVTSLIGVTGTGWVAEETINPVTIGGETATHTLTVDTSGNLSGDITVPVLAPGTYDIVITGTGSGVQTFTAAFTVTS